ncbi:restriction endonuclease [Mycolicibacterium moriokaense]|nr:restriction endonuclease [Mycolicibacterium moriokaense]
MADAPAWLAQLLGWKPATQKSVDRCTALFREPIAPNIADLSSTISLQLAAHAYETLDISRSTDAPTEEASGTALERQIESDLRSSLREKDPERSWSVTRRGTAARYAQYTHLTQLQTLLEQTPVLRATFAGDYLVKTDVYVGVENAATPDHLPFLHAAISSKWTIRSDRVQNVRHEFATLVRNRRGRCPHLVLVTAEPLPTRVLAIARGTGEIDAVYHLLYDEIDLAVSVLCQPLGPYEEQRAAWTEMAKQQRIKPYSELVNDLILS